MYHGVEKDPRDALGSIEGFVNAFSVPSDFLRISKIFDLCIRSDY